MYKQGKKRNFVVINATTHLHHNKKMRQSVFKFIFTFFLYVVVFALQKPLFMLFHHDIYESFSLNNYISVILNGLPLDFSMAGYLSIIPGILLIASQWAKNIALINKTGIAYHIIIGFIISLAMCCDMALYGYWGFRLDTTPLFYLSTSPQAAMASVSFYHIILAIIAIAVITIGISSVFCKFVAPYNSNRETDRSKKIRCTIILSILTVALFIPIRGGFTVSTMNLSAVYFSPNQRLNHAAINPLFSFMYSATHQNNFASQFRYFEEDMANEIFNDMTSHHGQDSTLSIINRARPNIYIIILESFSTHLLGTGITPNLDSIITQSVYFKSIYANGIRTDRGIPAILSGYPALPNTSIMKYVDKTDKLPAIARTLKNNGWTTSYYYGGDTNFTNMHAYLVSSGFENIICDKDFPISERLSKWGAHDHLVFNRCISDITSSPSSSPQFRVIQTSSSHEPFEVPFQKLDTPQANAFAYTDSCLGDFICNLKRTREWENSLLILTSDHYGAYPKSLAKQTDRHHIPLLFTGGVISAPKTIEAVGSQIDIAATLLRQLGIGHDDFIFSKNLLDTNSPHFAFIAAPSLFGMITNQGYIIYDYDANKVIETHGADNNLTEKGKAFIQILYNDLDKR